VYQIRFLENFMLIMSCNRTKNPESERLWRRFVCTADNPKLERMLEVYFKDGLTF